MTDTITHYSLTRAHDTHADTDTHMQNTHIHTHTFNLSLSFSMSHTHTHTYIRSFIDSLTTLFRPSIFQQRVKDSWRKKDGWREDGEKMVCGGEEL